MSTRWPLSRSAWALTPCIKAGKKRQMFWQTPICAMQMFGTLWGNTSWRGYKRAALCQSVHNTIMNSSTYICTYPASVHIITLTCKLFFSIIMEWNTYIVYSGSNNCPNVCIFCTKVNIPSCCLTWALTYECMKWSTYPWLSINIRIKRFEEDLME